MPAIHSIDDKAKLLVTVWEGEATDENFEAALKKYIEDFRSNTDYYAYNELVDLTKANPIKISIKGLLSMGRIATQSNADESQKRMALVVESDFAYSLANMYIFYRNAGKRNRKKIAVFTDQLKAYKWVKVST